MNDRLEYFPFFVEEFTRLVITWPPDRIGVYMLLLVYQWEFLAVPGDDIEALARIVRDSPANMKRLWPGPLEAQFLKTDVGWQNVRLEQIRVGVQATIDRYKALARAGVEGRQSRRSSGSASGGSHGATSGRTAGFTTGATVRRTAGMTSGETIGFASGAATGAALGSTIGNPVGVTVGHPSGFTAGVTKSTERVGTGTGDLSGSVLPQDPSDIEYSGARAPRRSNTERKPRKPATSFQRISAIAREVIRACPDASEWSEEVKARCRQQGIDFTERSPKGARLDQAALDSEEWKAIQRGDLDRNHRLKHHTATTRRTR